MKKLYVLLALPLAAFIAVQNVQAWTQEECPTKETHPDCEQYFPSPSPAVSPVASASATPEVVNTEPDRIDSPTASRGQGIGGGP